MRINITARGTTVQDSFREILENKLERFERFFDGETTADVTVTTRGHRETVEITIHSGGRVFRSEQTTSDRQDSLDLCVDALFRQITRHKDKLTDHLNHEAIDFARELSEEYIGEDEDEEGYDVVRTKRFIMKPMLVEEAILQMNLIGHQFFMFLNGDTLEMSVVYRRDDGNYGLIEADY